MKTLFGFLLLSLTLLFVSFSVKEKRILVFSKTKGYRHESIGVGKLAFMKLGKENNFEVDTTEDASAFTKKNLHKYDAIIFLSTTGDVLNEDQQNVFMHYIQGGKGFVGIHSATDTEYDWPWYGKLVGAYFKSHPKQQTVNVLKQPLEEGWPNLKSPEPWQRFDELYNYKNISPNIHVLFKLDESSYQGGENNGDHPIIWFHDFDGGRAFYTGFGHTKESYADPVFLSQLVSALNYAMGR